MAQRPYVYDPRSMRYRDRETGRWIGRNEIRRTIDAALDNANRDAVAVFERLRSRRITLAAAELELRRLVKDVHLFSAAASAGGWDRLDPQSLGRVGNRVRREYAFLRERLRAVEQGRTPLDGRLANSFRQFMQAGRLSFTAQERAGMEIRGFLEERNVLASRDRACPGCLAESARGWVPLKALVTIGERIPCRRQCRCGLRYRNPATGEIAA